MSAANRATVGRSEAMTSPDTPAAARVLVVEDTPQIADLVSRALGFEGYDVQVVGDGALALERIAEWQPQLVPACEGSC